MMFVRKTVSACQPFGSSPVQPAAEKRAATSSRHESRSHPSVSASARLSWTTSICACSASLETVNERSRASRPSA
jgi:hypothetical protein